jgi:hypothetical protein
MRDFKSMKRQRSRGRGGGGGGGGGKPQHNVNRAFDSNGPDGVKIRGHAQHVFEKYQQLARDAASSGDRVLAENYLQHAEHYFRVLRAVQPQRPASEIIGRDAFASGIDIDFEDESGGQEAQEAEASEGAVAEEGGEGQRGEQRQDGGRDRDREHRGERRPEYREGGRDRDRDRDRGRGERREGGWRDEVRGEPRSEGPREERYGRDERRREDRFRDDRRGERFERGERPAEGGPEAMQVVEPQGSAQRGDREDDGATLRSQDGGFSPAPAFLQARGEPGAEGGEAPSEPRGRRRRRSRGDAATEPTAEEA